MTRKKKTKKKATTTKKNSTPTKGSKEERTERIVERVRRVLEEELDPDDVFAEIEDVALNTTNEAVRRVLEQVLRRKAAALPEEVEIGGDVWRRHQPGRGKYYSLCGTLEVQRATYRRVGVRNGATCVPLDLAVGMVDRMTPAMSASVALGHAHGPMREYEKTLIAAGRRPPPRATLERLAAAAGDAAIEAIDQSEPLIRAGEALPDGAHALCVGLDRTTTPMEEQLPRERAKRARKRRKPRIRRPPPPVEVNYRMAYVGVVNIVDEDRNTSAGAEKRPVVGT